MKYITVKLTPDQYKTLVLHLNSLLDHEIDDNQKAFLQRLLTKLAKAKNK